MIKRCVAAGIAVVMVAGVLAGCAGTRQAAGAAVVKAGSATSVSAAGMTVQLPPGAAPTGTHLSLSAGAVPSIGLPAGVRTFGQEALVTLTAVLSSPATVSFPAPMGLSAQSLVPVVVWQDDRGGWRILPTTWSPGQMVVTAQTDHFTGGFLGAIDVKAWAKRAGSDVANYVTGRSGVAAPARGNEQAARADGVRVVSDQGDSVMWCFGVQDGKRVLKVANNRRTFTDVSYPASWQVLDGSSVT